MEDKQIIELYWERSEDAIKETESKYGWLCTNIANHILENTEEAELCVKESMELLWDTIPPHRPQNLKAYLCKVTRNHALQMKYAEFLEQEVNLFEAELVIYDFLKGLEPEQRKLFVARYWYLSLVSEIAMQYKMSEGKVEKTVQSLRQKLDGMLEEKHIHLHNEEELLFAMTEIEDRYLVEAEPVHVKLEKQVKVSVDTKENGNLNAKDLLSRIWNKKMIVAIACIVLLVVVSLVWPKNPIEQNPTESDKPNTEIVNKEPVHIDEDDTTVVSDNFVHIVGEDIFHKDDLEVLKKTHPWNETMQIAALPVYKNLSFYDNESLVQYMNEDEITAKAQNIAEQLNMNIIGVQLQRGSTDNPQNKYVISGIWVTTDTGSIEIDALGKVTVSFLDGVQLPNGYDMSDATTIEHANNKVVAYLMDKYKEVIEAPYFGSSSYPTYDADGNRTMHFRAIVDNGDISNVQNILDYNFNQVEFYYKEDYGLTGFSFGDVRFATELVDYYPIVSLEEAKKLLKEGNYESDFFHSEADLLSYENEEVLGVELTYKVNKWEKVFQPYYCFYIKTAGDNLYSRCYVPAVEGVRVDIIEESTNLLYFPESVEIIDMSEYVWLDGWIYYKDGNPYTLKNGIVTEATNHDTSEDPIAEYGEVVGETTDNGTDWILYYKGEPIVNLTRLNIPPSGSGKNNVNAKYIEGHVIVFDILYPNSDPAKPVATVYRYSEEEQSLTPYMFSVPLYGYSQPNGLKLTDGRYGTMVNDAGEILIVDLLTGESANTGILNENVEYICNASDDYYAVLYRSGEIVLIDKVGGYSVKQTKYQLSFTPNFMKYQDNMLYISSDYGNIIFVISEFEALD